MGRRATYSRSDIIDAAFELVDAEGMGALTARAVGERLRASTAPVYRHFSSMEELARAVMERAQTLLLHYCAERYSHGAFLNEGIGTALFARDHPQLYRALYLESDTYRDLVDGVLDALTDAMLKDDFLSAMSREDRMRLLQHMWTYTHGLAALIVAGLVEDASQVAITDALVAVGGPIITQALKDAGLKVDVPMGS